MTQTYNNIPLQDQALAQIDPQEAKKLSKRSLPGVSESRSIKALRGRRSRYLVSRLMAESPWLQPSDRISVRALAECTSRLAELADDLDERGYSQPDPDNSENTIPRAMLNSWKQLSDLQLRLLTALGMTPGSRAQMRVQSLSGDSLALRLAAARLEDE